MDTGASCSMLKIDNVNPTAELNRNDKLVMGGAFGGKKTSFGSITTNLNFQNQLTRSCKFHIIGNTNTIPGDGILGADFLVQDVVMDTVGKVMYGYRSQDKTLVVISTEFGTNKATMEDIAPWGKFSNGLSQRIMEKMGYSLNGGLRKKSRG